MLREDGGGGVEEGSRFAGVKSNFIRYNTVHSYSALTALHLGTVPCSTSCDSSY